MLKQQIINKLNEIVKLPAAEQKAYDTSMTWAFMEAVQR